MRDAKTYQRIRQRLTLVHLALTPAILWLAVAAGFSQVFSEWAASWTVRPFAALGLYYLLFSLYASALDFPFAIYSGYFLEHRFGLSNETFARWFMDFIKKGLIAFFIGLVLIESLYGLIWNFPERWWLYAWAFFALFSYGMGKLFPILIVPLFYRYGPVPEALRERILSLVRRYGLPSANVYSLNLSRTTKKANAAFMGLGRTKRVVLSDTLIEQFTPDEIETVVAHELGHYKHRDIWKGLVLGLVVSFLLFLLASRVAEPLARISGFEGVADPAALPLLYLLAFGFSFALAPIQNGFSRWLERAADRFALACQNRPEVFISCMEKLGRVNLADPDPNPVYEWFFYDHPAIAKRVGMAKAWKTDGKNSIGTRYNVPGTLYLVPIGFLILSIAGAGAYGAKKTESLSSLERRQRAELMRFFLAEPGQAEIPRSPVAVEFYNEAVNYFQKGEYILAREALKASIAADNQNALAHELLGDIASVEHKLEEARVEYETAYRLRPTEPLKKKIQKAKHEFSIEEHLVVEEGGRFIVRYAKPDLAGEPFPYGDLLEKVYERIEKDFGYSLREPLTVILYDYEDFKVVTDSPHWIGGVFDGKVRMPVGAAIPDFNLEAVAAHEITHAFVAGLSARKAPPWLSEGLSEYEEGRVKEIDLIVLESAVATDTVMPLDQLMTMSDLMKNDPLWVGLFYQQSYHLVRYLIDRYGMFAMKKLLKAYAENKNDDESIRETYQITIPELEKEWQATLIKSSL